MTASDAEEERAFQLLLRKIKTVKGLDFSQYRPSCLKRRIDTRLRAHELKNYNEYSYFLSKNPTEFDKLLDATTINVSEFFRDQEAWDFVQETVIPNIIELKESKKQRTIHVWSAGSSGGEEAYTLAILFHEILGKKLDRFLIKIYGTDIDKASLKRAVLGCYAPASVQNVTTDRLNRYFKFDGKQYTVNQSIQLLTSFQFHDLVSTEPLKFIDFIVCRNVLIYFTKELQAKIMAKFSRALQANGFLMLGKTESFGPYMEEYFKPYHSHERIYRKR